MQVTYRTERSKYNFTRFAEVEGITFCALTSQLYYVQVKNKYAVVSDIITKANDYQKQWIARIEKIGKNGSSIFVANQFFPNQDDAFIWAAKELLKST
jgi:GTP-dependent phosphoenolpyruvate carboxykinase